MRSSSGASRSTPASDREMSAEVSDVTPHDHDGVSLERYRERARAWLTSVTIPQVPDDEEGAFAALRTWQRALYEGGWLGISWSKTAGGQGLTPAHQLVVAEESARAGAPQPIGLIGLEVVGPTIDTYGTEEQRATLLPALLSGDDIWCQGFSEPEAGSDLASLTTRARIEGDEFVINGQKVWTSWAHKADWCALLVRTDAEAPKHRGISYVLVDMRSEGVTARPIVQMTGEGEFCEVFFDEVRVPVSNLLGRLNDGWNMAMDTLAHERGGTALRNRVVYEVELATAVQELRAHYSADDAVQPSDFVCEQVGTATIAVAALEAQTRATADRLLSGDIPNPYDSIDKLSLNWTEQRLHRALEGLLGTQRVVTDSRPLGLASRRVVRDHFYSRACSIYGGAEQVQRNIIAQRLLRLPNE